MKISEIITLIEGRVICGQGMLDQQVGYAFASDLMSDVLTVKPTNFVLITGLANVQAIRTAEMSDVRCVLLVRGKRPTEDMIRLACENDIVLLSSPCSMFRASGLLYGAGIQPIF